MSKIVWKSKDESDHEEAKHQNEMSMKEQLKGKGFKNLTSKEKDELLERIARQLGYL